jgi:serpin B
MPRFEFDSSLSLNEMLRGMDLEDAFPNAADYSGTTGNTELFLSCVIHRAFVSADEHGTEASAATTVEMRLKSVPLDPVEVAVNHPFIFTTRDIATGSILFVGRVFNPL